MNTNLGIARAVDQLGGRTRLADALGVTPQAVGRWLSGLDKVPAERAVQIEELTGVRCEVMRPDVNWAVLRHVDNDAPEASVPQ